MAGRLQDDFFETNYVEYMSSDIDDDTGYLLKVLSKWDCGSICGLRQSVAIRVPASQSLNCVIASRLSTSSYHVTPLHIVDWMPCAYDVGAKRIKAPMHREMGVNPLSPSAESWLCCKVGWQYASHLIEHKQ